MQTRSWTFGKVATAFLAAGVLAGFVAAASRPARYISRAVLEQRTENPVDIDAAFAKASEGDLEKVRSDIQVVKLEGGRIELSFRASGASEALSTNAALVRRLIEGGNFRLVEPPSTVREPVASRYGLPVASGIAGGLALAAVVSAWLKRKRRVPERAD